MTSHASAARESPLGKDAIDCILIRKAEIKLPNKSSGEFSKFEYANYGHEIKLGSGNIFAVRIFSDDGSGPDAATFEKITLSISDVDLKKDAAEEKLEVVGGYYTAGGVGFVRRGDYWRSVNQNPIPDITIFKSKNGLSARISATVRVVFISTKEYKDVRVGISSSANGHSEGAWPMGG